MRRGVKQDNYNAEWSGFLLQAMALRLCTAGRSPRIGSLGLLFFSLHCCQQGKATFPG